MAVNATAVYRVRTAGNNANGGGYDAGIASAGTDYSQQDAAQLSVADAVTNGTTTVTSTTGGFTAAMIGNAAWMSGVGVTTGAYFVTAVASTNSITVDRSPGTGTGGTLKVGGGWADPRTNITGTPAYIVAGNIISIRAGGTGSVASPDYTLANFISTPNGTTAAGYIKFIGENGRPYIKTGGGAGAMFNAPGWNWFENMYWIAGQALGVGFTGSLNAPIVVSNVIADQNGFDAHGIVGAGTIVNSEVFSSTANAGAAGANHGIEDSDLGWTIINTNVHDCWGHGVLLSDMSRLIGSVVAKNKGSNVRVTTSNNQKVVAIIACTIDAPGSGNGIDLTTAIAVANTTILGNFITNCSVNGIKTNTGTLAANDLTRGAIDYNSYYNNGANALNLTIGTGLVNGVTLHDNLLGADPYTAQSTENYAVISADKALGFPQAALLQSFAGQTTGVRSYVDPGGVQRQEPEPTPVGGIIM